MSNLDHDFGAVLKRLRGDRGLSQEAFAHDSGLDRTFISLLERGKRQPSLSTVFQIANALNISAEDLVRQVSVEQNKNKGARE